MGMAGSLTHDILKGPPPPPIDRGWGGGGGGSEGRGSSRRASFTGLFGLIAARTMGFPPVTTAFVVPRGVSHDWAPLPKPPILLLNTTVLPASNIGLYLS